MRLKKILFSSILLISSSVNSIASESKYVLTELYQEVMVTINTYCKEDQYFIPIKRELIMDNLSGLAIGQCYTDEKNYWSIHIDKLFWDTHNEDDRYSTMAHEMMHCIFFKNHVDNKDNYMYYSLVHITKEEVIEQLTVDLKKECGDKDGK